MELTKHAQKRCQQRAIPVEVLDILDALGIEGLQKGGSLLQTMSRKELLANHKKLKQAWKYIDRLKKSYCVRSDSDSVITAGHHYKKIKTVNSGNYGY